MSGSQKVQFEIDYSMPGHSQSWQGPGSLRFDSAKSLWTWRAIWSLMSGSGVADSSSRRSQPRSETDLWPSVDRPPNRKKTHAKTAEAIISQSPTFGVRTDAAVHTYRPTLRLNDSRNVHSAYYTPKLCLQKTSNEVRFIPLMNILQTITKFIDCPNCSWTHFSKDMNKEQMNFLNLKHCSYRPSRTNKSFNLAAWCSYDVQQLCIHSAQ